jgi:hypothetical protein
MVEIANTKSFCRTLWWDTHNTHTADEVSYKILDGNRERRNPFFLKKKTQFTH